MTKEEFEERRLKMEAAADILRKINDIEYGKFLSKQIDALESFLKKPYDTLVNTFIIKGLEDECSQIDMESREFILSKYREMLERLKQKFEAL